LRRRGWGPGGIHFRRGGGLLQTPEKESEPESIDAALSLVDPQAPVA
jgi:hypothetical protein